MRHSLEFFANEMEKRLVENDHKIPWEDVSGIHLYSKAMLNLAKSWDKVLVYIMTYDGQEIPNDMLNGFIDAANYCMMLYTAMHHKTRNNINGHKQEKE